jgi:hypothetical protein
MQLIALLVWTGTAWAQGGQGAFKPSVGDSGRAMFATFTAPTGYTLLTWAQHLFGPDAIGFDWQQTVTNWPNPDLQCLSCGHDIVPVTQQAGSLPPFLDPVLGGYTYNPCGGTAPGSSGGANPFYYNTSTENMDCWSLINNETTKKNPTTLTFGDEPMDPELTSTEISQNNVPTFMTALVGITTDPQGKLIASPTPFSWTWQSTYNGMVGGIATTANDPSNPDNPTGGKGRVTILTINGVPVPEPSGLSLLIPGTLTILAAHWSVRRRRPAPKMFRP